jgi:hypothetical protein
VGTIVLKVKVLNPIHWNAFRAPIPKKLWLFEETIMVPLAACSIFVLSAFANSSP